MAMGEGNPALLPFQHMTWSNHHFPDVFGVVETGVFQGLIGGSICLTSNYGCTSNWSCLISPLFWLLMTSNRRISESCSKNCTHLGWGINSNHPYKFGYPKPDRPFLAKILKVTLNRFFPSLRDPGTLVLLEVTSIWANKFHLYIFTRMSDTNGYMDPLCPSWSLS